MSIEFNPLDIFRDVMRLKYGWVPAVPALACAFLSILGFVLILAHSALLNLSSSGIGIALVANLIERSWFGNATLGMIMAVFVLWLLMFSIAGIKGGVTANLSRPKLHLTNPKFQKRDRYTFDATLSVNTPFTVPQITIVANSPTIASLETYDSSGWTETEHDETPDGISKTIRAAAGDYTVKIYTRSRESVNVNILLGNEVVIRKIFRPK